MGMTLTPEGLRRGRKSIARSEAEIYDALARSTFCTGSSGSPTLRRYQNPCDPQAPTAFEPDNYCPSAQDVVLPAD
jgi:hypothetical protein